MKTSILSTITLWLLHLPVTVSCIPLVDRDYCTVLAHDSKLHTLKLPTGPVIPFSGKRPWYFDTTAKPSNLTLDGTKKVKVHRK